MSDRGSRDRSSSHAGEGFGTPPEGIEDPLAPPQEKPSIEQRLDTVEKELARVNAILATHQLDTHHDAVSRLHAV